MVYNHHQIFDEIQSIISIKPGISLLELAQRLCLDRHTLEKSVQIATGMSFRQYKQIMLLERSQKLLSQMGIRSTKQIAQEMGFSATASFSRFFKTATGMTPTNFRRQFLRLP